jgi:hypothetical protein
MWVPPLLEKPKNRSLVAQVEEAVTCSVHTAPSTQLLSAFMDANSELLYTVPPWTLVYSWGNRDEGNSEVP